MDPKGKSMKEVLLIVWVAVGLVIIVGTAIAQGYADDQDNDAMAQAVCIGLVWPVILAVAACIGIIAGPIWLLRKLGGLLKKLAR